MNRHKRQLFMMLEYERWIFNDGFSWCLAFISHVYFEKLVWFNIIYYGSILHGYNNLSLSLLLLFPNKLHLGLLMLKQCNKTYRNATSYLEDAINLEAKQTAKRIKLDNRIECTVKNPAFIMLKNYKANFRTRKPWRLLNPCKY